MEFHYKDGFIFRPWDGYLRIDSDKINIVLNQQTIKRAREALLNYDIKYLSFGTLFDDLKNIDFLKDFMFLKGIDIGITDFDISPIHELDGLEDINIPFNFGGRIDFTRFKHLKSVFINWENAGVESLFECPQLERVSIMKYGGLSLMDFEKLPNLKELFLYEPRSISLEGIGSLEKLERLEISNAKKLKDLGDLEDLLSLKKLFLHGAKHLEDLHPVMYLKNLRILNLDNLGKISSIKFLETLKNLEEFYMAESTNIEDGDLSVLEHLRKHHKLDKVIFTNRRHYSHTREQLGYQVPPEVAAIFAKKGK